MSNTEATTEVTYEIGEIAHYSVTSKWGTYSYTGPIVAKRTMKKSGKTFYTIGISRGVTADHLSKVEAE